MEDQKLSEQLGLMLSYFYHASSDSCPQHIPDVQWKRQMKRTKELLKKAGFVP